MSTPINYFYAAKHVFFGRTALLLFREKHTFELVCTQHMYVQPSDAIGVMVGLKISRLGGKIGQSSPLAPCLPACLPGPASLILSWPTPLHPSDLRPSWHYAKCKCVHFSQGDSTSRLHGIFHIVERSWEKIKTWMFTWTCQPLNSWPIVQKSEGEARSTNNTPAQCSGVCSSLIEAFFKGLCYQTKFHSSLTVQTNFAASYHESKSLW